MIPHKSLNPARLLLPLLLAATVHANPAATALITNSPLAGLDLSAGVMGTSGDVGFEIGYPDEPILSKLVYPMDAALFQVSAEYTFPKNPEVKQDLRLRARFAHSLQLEGTSSDTDYGDFENYSESDSSGTVLLWDADLILLHPLSPDFRLGAFAGIGSQSFRYEDSNLVNYSPESFSVSGPNATYDVVFDGLRFGVLGEANLGRAFLLSAELSLTPFLRADADGYWILRDFTFQQEADGMGWSGRVMAEYRVNPRLSVFGAAGFTSLVTADGTESGAEAGDSFANEPAVREITGEYASFELGLKGRF
jgi:hypothetical protein